MNLWRETSCESIPHAFWMQIASRFYRGAISYTMGFRKIFLTQLNQPSKICIQPEMVYVQPEIGGLVCWVNTSRSGAKTTTSICPTAHEKLQVQGLPGHGNDDTIEAM